MFGKFEEPISQYRELYEELKNTKWLTILSF